MPTDIKHHCNGHSHIRLAQFRIVPQFELRSYCVCGLFYDRRNIFSFAFFFGNKFAEAFINNKKN